MVAVEYDRELYLPETGLWLDARRSREFAFVSHAHSDHTGRHRHILCTPATARLMQTRMGGKSGAWETLEFHQKKTGPEWSATLLPAGHVLGSAQIFLECASGTLLYTGDFKLRRGLASETATAVHAETLVMETTYGLPRYQFPPAEETLADILKFCADTLENGGTPVLLAYSLGKAQEVLAALRDTGFPIVLHDAVWKITRVYEEFGVQFPPYTNDHGQSLAGHVVVCPPNGKNLLEKIPRSKLAALTGWALDRGVIYRLGVDAVFPLSDHAGYDDLLRHVEAVQPKRVLTLHGFAREFARDLRAKGIEAWALNAHNQLEFSL